MDCSCSTPFFRDVAREQACLWLYRKKEKDAKKWNRGELPDQTFHVGVERRILFTYDPFDGLENLPLPGPVFVHEAAYARYLEIAVFPEDLRSYPAVLNVYAKGPKLLEQVYASPGEAETRLVELLTDPAVDYIEMRDRKAGCFDFRVERTQVKTQPTEDFKC